MSNIIDINAKANQTKEQILQQIEAEADQLLTIYTDEEGQIKLSFVNMTDAEMIYVMELVKNGLLSGEI